MTTYSDMQSRIADELANDGEITTTQIKLAIQSAIKNYQRRPFYFNQKKASTFQTVASQEYYTASDLADIPNIIEFNSFVIGTYKSNVRPVDHSDIEVSQNGSVTGQPCRYAYYNQKIRLFPMPDAVYTATLSYVYRLAALSADGDTNAWVDELDAEELIRQSAKRVLALDILHADDIALRCYNREAEVLSDLLAETRRRNPVTTLQVPPMPSMRDSFNINTG